MTTSSGKKHAGRGPASDEPPVPEPTFAERARTLVYLGRIGSLSTLSRKQSGFPFGSVMPFGLDDHGPLPRQGSAKVVNRTIAFPSPWIVAGTQRVKLKGGLAIRTGKVIHPTLA
jgi:hypothetical protein